MGSHVAAEITERGATVALVDAGHATSATRLSGGMVRAFDVDPALRPYAARSVYADDSPLRSPSAGYEPVGSVVFGAPRSELDQFASLVRESKGQTAPEPVVGTFDSAGIRAPESVAVYEPAGGVVVPAMAAKSAATRMQSTGRGVALVGEPVLRIRECGGVARIEFAHADLSARIVLLATGAWSSRSFAGLDMPYKVRVRSIQYCLVERFPPAGVPAFLDLTSGIYFAPVANALLVGRALPEWDVYPAHDGPQEQPDARHAKRALQDARAFLPDLAADASYSVIRGFDGYAPGDAPLVDTVLDGRVYLVRPQGGSGVKVAPALAQEVAALTEKKLKGMK